MSEPEISPERSAPDTEDRGPGSGGGINLVLVYTLMLLAFLAAIGFAALIVLPYYHRR